MMKKVLFAISILLICCCTVGSIWMVIDHFIIPAVSASAYIIPRDWKTIEIENLGTLKAPDNWSVNIKNEFIYFVSNESGDVKDVLVQFKSGGTVNDCFLNIEDWEWQQDTTFSNGVSLARRKLYYEDDLSEEMFVLSIPDKNYSPIVFYCVDDSVSESTLRKIAYSYELYN